MGLGATARRRWFGAIVLVLALLMLVLGQTVLSRSLSGVVYLFYWLLCFVLILLAVVVAFRDARAIQNEIRTEQRSLLESTLKDIENEARNRQKRTKRNGGNR